MVFNWVKGMIEGDVVSLKQSGCEGVLGRESHSSCPLRCFYTKVLMGILENPPQSLLTALPSGWQYSELAKSSWS